MYMYILKASCLCLHGFNVLFDIAFKTRLVIFCKANIIRYQEDLNLSNTQNIKIISAVSLNPLKMTINRCSHDFTGELLFSKSFLSIGKYYEVQN